MKTILFGLVFISPPFLKTLLLRWFCRADIGRRASIGWFSAVMGGQVSLGDHCAIRPFTLIRLTGEVRLGSYSEISSFCLIYGASNLIVGKGSYIGPQSLINADETVRLGEGSALGPRSMVFTHGSFLPYHKGYWVKRAGVAIGDEVWCAAGVFVHPGTEIGDNSFVNARSVVTQAIPAGSVVEGNPARVICPMSHVQQKMSPRRVDAAMKRVLRDFADIGLRRELAIQRIDESPYHLDFDWHRQAYRVSLIPSSGATSRREAATGARRIFIVNLVGWDPPENSMALDLASLQTRFTPDRIHTSLRLFMLRYYGIRFTDTSSFR